MAVSTSDVHQVLFNRIDTFASIMLPDYFTCAFGEFHQQIFDLWDSDEEYVMLIMPRGWGKTTLLQMLMMREGLYQRSKFTLFVSDTNDQSEEKLEAMKEEFATNERVIEFFGEQHNKKHWKVGNFKINKGTVYKCRGAGQSMRGIKDRNNRPDLIIIDDLENDENVGTPQQREKLHKWFYATLLPTAIRKGKRVRLVGTIIESESFLTTIMDQTKAEIEAGRKPTWKIIVLGELDEYEESRWPQFKPTEQILAEKEEYRYANRLDVWYRERMSCIISDDGRLPPKHLKKIMFATEEERHRFLQECHSIIVSHDPAISTNPRADRAAIVVVAFKGKEVYIIDGHRQVGMPPDDQVRKALEYANKYRAQYVLYENVAFQQALKYSYERLKHEYRHSPIVEGYKVPPNKSKTLRIEHALRAALLDGNLFIVDHVYEIMKEEMASFPNGKRDFLDSITQAINYQVDNDIFYEPHLAAMNKYAPVGGLGWAP